ncbi:MAG TPA: helix-turn-helix domain-containing protein [Solirubrobacteraceae bacterium]|jgi:DNA-binding transcriptional ArsR family regulator
MTLTTARGDDALVLLGKAVGHPLRVQILRSCAMQDRRSPSQIASELRSPLGRISYHVSLLSQWGFLDLVETIPRRGAVEHRYRLATLARERLEAMAPAILQR